MVKFLRIPTSSLDPSAAAATQSNLCPIHINTSCLDLTYPTDTVGTQNMPDNQLVVSARNGTALTDTFVFTFSSADTTRATHAAIINAILLSKSASSSGPNNYYELPALPGGRTLTITVS